MGAPSKEECRRAMYEDGLDPFDDEPKCPLCGNLLESKKVIWDIENETYVHEECYEKAREHLNSLLDKDKLKESIKSDTKRTQP